MSTVRAQNWETIEAPLITDGQDEGGMPRASTKDVRGALNAIQSLAPPVRFACSYACRDSYGPVVNNRQLALLQALAHEQVSPLQAMMMLSEARERRRRRDNCACLCCAVVSVVLVVYGVLWLVM
jgi:hypothetical protein